MPEFLKDLLIEAGKGLIAIALVFVMLFGYVAYSERAASARAEDFCRSVAPGTESSMLLDLAISQGADTVQTKWRQVDGQDRLAVTFSGAMPLSRHICWIKAAQGRVVSTDVVYLD